LLAAPGQVRFNDNGNSLGPVRYFSMCDRGIRFTILYLARVRIICRDSLFRLFLRSLAPLLIGSAPSATAPRTPSARSPATLILIRIGFLGASGFAYHTFIAPFFA
jgi:hypothetical protein